MQKIISLTMVMSSLSLWEEDQKIAKLLLNRKVGEAPILGGEGH